MILDANYFDNIKKEVLAHITDQMSTKEKQKMLSKHIIWTEPKSNAHSRLL